MGCCLLVPELFSALPVRYFESHRKGALSYQLEIDVSPMKRFVLVRFDGVRRSCRTGIPLACFCSCAGDSWSLMSWPDCQSARRCSFTSLISIPCVQGSYRGVIESNTQYTSFHNSSRVDEEKKTNTSTWRGKCTCTSGPRQPCNTYISKF